jgi:hypothetical protein
MAIIQCRGELPFEPHSVHTDTGYNDASETGDEWEDRVKHIGLGDARVEAYDSVREDSICVQPSISPR